VTGKDAHQILAGALAVAAEQIDLVEHRQHGRRVPGQRDQVPLVPGRIGVLLRVDDPHEEVDKADEPVDLRAVRGLDRVEVGEVEEHQAGWSIGEDMPRAHVEPVEQGRVDFASDGGGRRRGRRSAHARAREIAAHEHVEQRRLPGPGRAGQGDHRGIDAVSEPLPGARDHVAGSFDRFGSQATIRESHGLGERGQALIERSGHRARSRL
jgi:hypothetical protein